MITDMNVYVGQCRLKPGFQPYARNANYATYATQRKQRKALS